MLYILTPTDQRPVAFALLEKWLGAQDWSGPFRWIVGTRDASPYAFRMNQIVVEREDTKALHPLCSNLLACFDALDIEPGDLALICEDDDYYAQEYLRRLVSLADGVSLAGQSLARYYHVGSRRYQQNHNTAHASLCQTAFRADVLPLLREICLRGNPSIDRRLWDEWRGTKRLEPSQHHIGCKGLPGIKGVGLGHRAHFGRSDADGRMAVEWGLPREYDRFRWK